MAGAGLDKETVIRKAAELANEIGYDKITLKLLAEHINVQPPSLYNHIKCIEELQKEIMLFGWRQMDKALTGAAVCVSGYIALEAICRAFYKYATENPGVFNAMLWYNKFESEETQNATKEMFSIIYKAFTMLNISKENSEHLIRTYGLTVFGSGRFFAAGDHAVHGLAQVAGKLGQPLGEKQRQQKQPDQGAGGQQRAGQQHPPLSCHGGEEEGNSQHGNGRAGLHQQKHGFDGHTPHFRSPPVH